MGSDCWLGDSMHSCVLHMRLWARAVSLKLLSRSYLINPVLKGHGFTGYGKSRKSRSLASWSPLVMTKSKSLTAHLKVRPFKILAETDFSAASSAVPEMARYGLGFSP